MSYARQRTLRVLLIEDMRADAELVLHHLKRFGMSFVPCRVESEVQLRRTLQEFRPAVILSDYELPGFDGQAALKIAREMAPGVPFLFVSGKMGEEVAIDALHRGAVDYVFKSNLARLGPAVARAVEEAARQRRQAAQIARLDRVLRMVGGINAAVLRIRERVELLREICRLAISVGGYAAVVAAARVAGQPSIQPVAWEGADERLAERLRNLCAESISNQQGIAERAMRSGEAVVQGEAPPIAALVALPILIDGTAVGVVMFALNPSELVLEQELKMLQEVGGNLSFAWQFLQKDTTVRFLSHFDSQTGLAKRSLFRDRLARLLSEGGGRSVRHAVLVLDVQHLGLLNDSFGRRTGDLLLQHLAARLKRRYPNTEQLAHFGGGTFAVMEDLLTRRSPEELIELMQARSVALVGEPFAIEQREVPMSLRMGIAQFPQDGKDADALLQHAEAALLHARAAGCNEVVYSAQRHSQRIGQLALEHKLRLALERGEFELHYQPKVSVITRRIQGVEALIRWRDASKGALVSPSAFLPVVESSGLGPDVGAWVLHRAARDCHEWALAGLPPVRVAVNVSPNHLVARDFVTTFLEAMQPWATLVRGLDIEVTEAALNEDADEEVAKLRALRRSGVRVAIDDFGTGYSSLRRLATLPVDTLKIDGSFIHQVPADGAGKTIVRTIVALARGFGMSTVAEGVETQEQLDYLWQVGCDQSQGYLHSKAIGSTELASLLQHGNGKLILPAEPESAAEAPAAASGGASA
jgi:diguanylate cyclase (GGDEF)-like protein